MKSVRIGRVAASPFFSNPEPSLDLSILLAVRNDVHHLEACLDSIVAQELGSLTWEIIVADGDSNDGSLDLLEKRARAGQIRLLRNPARRVSTGLNIALRAARGRILSRLDGHAFYAPDYIRQSLTRLEESDAAAVGGIQIPVPGGPGLFARAIAALQTTWLGLGRGTHRRMDYEGPADSLWLGTFRRDLVERIGGFDEALFRSEDNDFYQRIRATGETLLVSHRIRARYVCRGTLAGLAHQALTTGAEILPTLRRNHRALSLRHLTPGLAVGGGLLLAGLGILTSSRLPLLLLGGMAAAYAVLVAATAVQVSRQHGAATGFALLPTLPVLHAAYGLGTLFGLLKVPGARRRGPRPRAS